MVIEKVLDVTRGFSWKISADDPTQIEVNRVHRVIHVHGDRNVIIAEKLNNGQGLIRRPVRVWLLPPFELAIEEIAVYVQIDLRGSIAYPRRRQPGFCRIGG